MLLCNKNPEDTFFFLTPSVSIAQKRTKERLIVGKKGIVTTNNTEPCENAAQQSLRQMDQMNLNAIMNFIHFPKVTQRNQSTCALTVNNFEMQSVLNQFTVLQ